MGVAAALQKAPVQANKAAQTHSVSLALRALCPWCKLEGHGQSASKLQLVPARGQPSLTGLIKVLWQQSLPTIASTLDVQHYRHTVGNV